MTENVALNLIILLLLAITVIGGVILWRDCHRHDDGFKGFWKE